MAEMSVPAWPMPIQKTKLVISKAQATGTFDPHTPTPVEMRYVAARMPPISRADEITNAGHHHAGCGRSVISPISADSESYVPGPHTSGMRGSGSGNRGTGGCACAVSRDSRAVALK